MTDQLATTFPVDTGAASAACQSPGRLPSKNIRGTPAALRCAQDFLPGVDVPPDGDQPHSKSPGGDLRPRGIRG
ncbi:MAG TPA: hypothetical protein VLS95_03070 [Arthrobacter sp.]|nr:hypothetical protein [Arthrobacter sp.]